MNSAEDFTSRMLKLTEDIVRSEDRITVCKLLAHFSENRDTEKLLTDLYALVDTARRESYPDPD